MNKGIKNTDNYFERVKQRANRTNYRYYFFDYLYFKGEVWGKKIGRMSGLYCCLVLVVGSSSCPATFSLINSVPEWSSLHLGYLGAMFLLICVFILARYRKARVQALLNRYRRSKHISAVQAYFLFLLPFVLFFLETWLFDEWGLDGLREVEQMICHSYIKTSDMEQRITSLLLPAPEAELEASCKETGRKR